MCVSTEILSEYAEILERYTSPEFAEAPLGRRSGLPLVAGRHARSHSICDLGHQ